MIDLSDVTHKSLVALVALMVLDILMGCLLAFGQRQLSSAVSRAGVTRKAGILVLVGVAYIVEIQAGVPVGFATALFYVFSEAVSVVENGARLGIPIPSSLRDSLAKLRGQGDAKPITIAITEESVPRRPRKQND